MNIPNELLYTKEHEWLRIDGDTAVVGITDFAQHELGDIVFIEVETVGETLEQGAVFGTIEAVKTVAELYMPVGAEIIEFNEGLNDAPESVNTDPYGSGWIVKVKTSAIDKSTLLDAAKYQELISQ